MKSPITLQSPSPLDDGGRKYNKLYLILGGIGAVIGIASGDPSGIIIGAVFGIMIAYTIKECILSSKLHGLRKLDFSLGNPVPYDELISKLIPILTPLGMTVEKSKNDTPVITYDKLIYDVTYTGNNTFNIWWRQSPARALFTITTKITLYRKAVIAMGIIGYHIQQITSSHQ